MAGASVWQLSWEQIASGAGAFPLTQAALDLVAAGYAATRPASFAQAQARVPGKRK